MDQESYASVDEGPESSSRKDSSKAEGEEIVARGDGNHLLAVGKERDGGGNNPATSTHAPQLVACLRIKSEENILLTSKQQSTAGTQQPAHMKCRIAVLPLLFPG